MKFSGKMRLKITLKDKKLYIIFRKTTGGGGAGGEGGGGQILIVTFGVVLKKSESEVSYILAELLNMCLKESCFPDC